MQTDADLPLSPIQTSIEITVFVAITKECTHSISLCGEIVTVTTACPPHRGESCEHATVHIGC